MIYIQHGTNVLILLAVTVIFVFVHDDNILASAEARPTDVQTLSLTRSGARFARSTSCL